MRLDTLSDIGVHRKENQDNYWSAILDVEGIETGVICLCDGMGGLSNGALASSIVVSAVREYFLSNNDLTGIESVLMKANKDVKTCSNDRAGTTCSIIECKEGTYNVVHIGDSRVYKISNDKTEKLTSDHSVLAQYNISKEEDPEMYEKYKSKLTRCIGVEDNIKLDYFSGSYSEGDAFVVCSDGLWHYFDNKVMSYDSISDLSSLISSCISSGETDNISCAVLYV